MTKDYQDDRVGMLVPIQRVWDLDEELEQVWARLKAIGHPAPFQKYRAVMGEDFVVIRRVEEEGVRVSLIEHDEMGMFSSNDFLTYDDLRTRFPVLVEEP